MPRPGKCSLGWPCACTSLSRGVCDLLIKERRKNDPGAPVGNACYNINRVEDVKSTHTYTHTQPHTNWGLVSTYCKEKDVCC